MKLTMVGTGYVGLVTGTCFAKSGHTVTCLDIDKDKIARLRRGECPIYEPGLAELMRQNMTRGRLVFTTDRNEAYVDAEVIFVCVGTPADENGASDLRAVFQVAGDIGEVIERLGAEAEPKLVVVKSTVPVGTTEEVRDAVRQRTARPFHVANNPEFLKEGAAVNDFLKPDRVVCGTEDPAAARVLEILYEPFVRQGNPIIMMDIRSSEMVKYASNAMLATKISFINEIANLCERYNANIRAVRDGMCADRRIGNQFLHPGLGFGGSCFPKDIQAVIAMGDRAGFDCRVSRAVYDVNRDQRRHFWRKIAGHYGDLKGTTLAFWGVAFKPETDDIREAPALTLMQEALDAGASVRAFDPVAAANLSRALPRVVTVDDMYAVLEGTDGLVICTEWSEFRNPDFRRMSAAMRRRVVFDGRNIFKRDLMRDEGFTYYSVGRDPVAPPEKGKPPRPASSARAR